MAKIFIRFDFSGGNTLGHDFFMHNAGTPSPATLDFSAASGGGTQEFSWISSVNQPNHVGATPGGAYSVEINVTSGNSNCTFEAKLARVDNTGAVQSETAYSSPQAAAAGLQTHTFNDPALGTWAADDRLVCFIRFTNNNAHGGTTTVTTSIEDSNSEVHTPFGVALAASAAGRSRTGAVLTTEQAGVVSLTGSASGRSRATAHVRRQVPLVGSSRGASRATGLLLVPAAGRVYQLTDVVKVGSANEMREGGTGAPGTRDVSLIANEVNRLVIWETPDGEPGFVGTTPTNDWIVELNVLSDTPDVTLRVQLIRFDGVGFNHSQTAQSAAQSASQGLHRFVFHGVDLDTWAATDVFRVDVRINNLAASPVVVTFETDTTDAEVNTALPSPLVALSGSARGRSSAAAKVTASLALRGSASASARAAANLDVPGGGVVLEGVASGTGTATAKMTALVALKGSSPAGARASARSAIQLALTGTVRAAAGASGRLGLPRPLSGAARASARGWGRVPTQQSLAGSARAGALLGGSGGKIPQAVGPVIYHPGAWGVYAGPVEIRVDGIDITAAVMFEDTKFKSVVNGTAGVAKIRVRDVLHEFSFAHGAEVTLDIAGLREWDGYVQTVRRGYYTVGLPEGPAETVRFFELGCIDRNVLFQKRFLYDKVDPTRVQLTTYPPGTADDTIIKDYVADHLDLGGDHISTAGVTNVGSPSLDDEISGAAGWSWGELLRFLRFHTGAIDYIDPDRVLQHVDVDTPNAPFLVTDRPRNVGDVTITDDFNRSVATGWGTGAIGTWSHNNTAGVSVDGDEAVVTSSATRTATTAIPASIADSPELTITEKIQWPSDLSGFFRIFGVALATADAQVSGSMNKSGQLQVSGNAGDGGSAFVNLTPPAANDVAWLSWRYEKATGTLRAKYWKDGTAEPDWQVTYSDTDYVNLPVINMQVIVNLTSPSTTCRWDSVSITGQGEAPIPEVGYRELEIDFDGSQLRNDAMIWGAGQGASNVVFSRVEDDPSITEHNRWQVGRFLPTVWRQATVDKIANSFVYGSPQNERGGKDDAVACRFVVYEQGLRAGQKVSVESEVFGFSDVLPIRSLEIDFPTPTDPRYRVVASHEIDDPWSTSEFWFPDFDSPGIEIPRIDIPIPELPPFDLCFPTRNLVDPETAIATVSWGKRVDGIFAVAESYVGLNEVENVFKQTISGVEDEYFGAYAYRPAQWSAPVETLIGFTILSMSTFIETDGGTPDRTEGGALTFDFAGDIAEFRSPGECSFTARWIPDDSINNPHPADVASLQVGDDPTERDQVPFEWALDTPYWVRICYEGGRARARVWKTVEAEPSAWMLEATNPAATKPAKAAIFLQTINVDAGYSGPVNRALVWSYRVDEGSGCVDCDTTPCAGEDPCLGLDEEDVPDPDPPTSGGFREEIEEISTPSGQDPTSTWFETSHQYLSGSEKVYLNGRFLRPGIDYVRHPVARWIEILSSVTVDPGDVVTVFYEIFLSTPPPEVL